MYIYVCVYSICTFQIDKCESTQAELIAGLKKYVCVCA